VLYSLRNHNVFKAEEKPFVDAVTASDHERESRDLRGALEDLNSSLWLSELLSEVNICVPFDTPVFGKELLLESGAYSDKNIFQKSALCSLVIDNIA